MLATLRDWRDQLLGRGEAAITVPVMDGALKPNRALDEAEVVAELPGLDDLASDGRRLLASAGATLWRLEGGRLAELRRFDAAITALALSPRGRIAVALGGRRVLVLDQDGAELGRLDTLGPQRLHAANGLAFADESSLLVSDGSLDHAPPQWCHDLMAKGRSGRVARWDLASGGVELLARGQAWAFGVLAQDGAVLHSESWRHRILRTDASGTRPLLAQLPAYPSRLATF